VKRGKKMDWSVRAVRVRRHDDEEIGVWQGGCRGGIGVWFHACLGVRWLYHPEEGCDSGCSCLSEYDPGRGRKLWGSACRRKKKKLGREIRSDNRRRA
jgi:hypothetical protein